MATKPTTTSHPETHPQSQPHKQPATNPPSQQANLQQPPRYNDTSGAVIIDWDGSPRFLSPQEEEERHTALQNAVREKMLGLLRKTEFTWARPDGRASESLPVYSPVKE